MYIRSYIQTVKIYHRNHQIQNQYLIAPPPAMNPILLLSFCHPALQSQVQALPLLL